MGRDATTVDPLAGGTAAADVVADLTGLLAAWIGRFEFSLQNEAEYDEANMRIRTTVSARPQDGLHVRAKILDGW